MHFFTKQNYLRYCLFYENHIKIKLVSLCLKQEIIIIHFFLIKLTKLTFFTPRNYNFILTSMYNIHLEEYISENLEGGNQICKKNQKTFRHQLP